MTKNKHNYNRGILQPNLGLYSQFLCGKYFLLSLVFITFFLWIIPWSYLYQFNWYQNIILLVSHVSPNIEKIPATENQFPEFSIGLVAFLNLVGPFVAIYSFLYGRRHVKKLAPILSGEVKPSTLIKGIVLSLILLILFFWGAFHFTGSTFYLPGLFFKSKPHFVGMMVGCWWGINFFLFGLSTLLFGLLSQK